MHLPTNFAKPMKIIYIVNYINLHMFTH